MNNHLIPVLVLSLVLAGCSSQGERRGANDSIRIQVINSQLNTYFDDWRGTPYQYGGQGRSGLDCSAFVANAYRELFGVVLPRTTEQQASAGRAVAASKVQPGDLVLFKTGFFDRHIGIYNGNGSFIHASQSKGVTRSRLDNPYWQRAFWKVVRPVNLDN